MQAGGRALAEAYPDRFVLGLGVSVAAVVAPVTGQGFDKPAQRMREYLQRMREAEDDEVAVPRLIAAMGPRMLEVAAEEADGAFPSAMPVSHTAYARSALGPDKLLVVGVAAYLGEDVTKSRAEAKASGLFQIPGSPYVENYRRLGYDLTEGPTDQLVTDAFAIGGPVEIADRLSAHLAAGADHVVVQVSAPGVKEMVIGLTQIAPELPT
jgi:probable F420-dependent oxidoreductase